MARKPLGAKTLETMADPQRYEHLAETQWGKYLTSVERQALERAHQLCGVPDVAFDVGAAAGRWSEMLDKLGWRTICVDVNPVSVRQCRVRLPNAICVLADPSNSVLPCKTESIGLILCIEVFPVMPTAWFISEAYRVLKPNGLVVGVFANKLSWRGYLNHVKATIQRRYDWYCTPYHRWRRQSRQHGFRFLFQEGLCWFPFSRASNSPLVNLCVAVEHWIGLRRLPAISPWVVFLAQKPGPAIGEPVERIGREMRRGEVGSQERSPRPPES